MTAPNPYAATYTRPAARRGGWSTRRKLLVAALATSPCWLPLLIFWSPAIAAAAVPAFVFLVVVRIRRKKPQRRVAVTPARARRTR